MEPILREEFNESYFDGKNTRYKHNGGYDTYQKNNSFIFFADKLFQDYNLEGKKVLEIGCAKGFILEELKDKGVNIYGVDFCEYATNLVREDLKNKVICEDALIYLKTCQDNEFDFIFSRWVLSCMTDEYLIELIIELNRVCLQQVHIVELAGNTNFYNIKSKEDWESFNWNNCEILNNL